MHNTAYSPFLEHVVSKEGIQRDQEMTKTTDPIRLITSFKNVRCLLGLAYFYRKFVKKTTKKLRSFYMTSQSKIRYGFGQIIDNVRLKNLSSD